MALSHAQKIIKQHLVEGSLEPGMPVTINLDQCLLQDATGTMAWLELEAIGTRKVKPFCMQYIDHNLLQEDNKNMDDHLFLMTIAAKYGAHVSLPGNGISHHVHKERFTRPGQTLIGCDSHTPTSGGSGMLAIGVGGMEVAVGMATGEFTLTMPKIIGVKLTEKLKPWSTGKDVILELLRRVNVDGGKGKIYEFFGDGVKTLDLSQRSTICNMGAETGATTSLFPSDQRTWEFFRAQNRENDYIPSGPDKGYQYQDIIEIDLSEIEPLIACPFSPGNVKPVREVAGIEVAQAIIGSSTNSSYEEMMACIRMLGKKERDMRTMLHLIPGSKQVLQTIARDGGILPLLRAGARITEPSCNACIGMGNAPAWETVSIRSFPRNWEGRSGTEHDQVYLASPETATACAITGEITDPRDLKLPYPTITPPKQYVIDDAMILAPTFQDKVRRGPNIKELEYRTSISDTIKQVVILKVGNDISTDHILPAGAKVLPLRSNIPAISEFVFEHVDPTFPLRAKKEGGGIIIGGKNYGQGSSREHAAIAPMHLGITAVIVKSFARIHRSNLLNFGILPLVFDNPKDYEKIQQSDTLEIKNIRKCIVSSDDHFEVRVGNKTISCHADLQENEKKILLKGGLLNYIRSKK